MTFYVIDTTKNLNEEKHFSSYNEIVQYLGQMSIRKYKQTHKERVILLTELGYGEDDKNSTLFVRSMQEQFEIGVVRDGRKTQCDITTIVAFQKPEYGD